MAKLGSLSLDKLIERQQKLADKRQAVLDEQHEVQREIDKRLVKRARTAGQTIDPAGIESEEEVNG